MRVIAGIARSMPLKAAEGDNTRPTTDRIKETLFNMLQSDIAGCRFLDLYSGSGAIGIEALSRGAKEAVLVENARADEIAYKVNCEQSSDSIGHWTGEQRPSLSGLYRNLESIGVAADLSWGDYADPSAAAYDLTLDHTKGIVTKPDQKYIGISVMQCPDNNNYVVITIEAYSDLNF